MSTLSINLRYRPVRIGWCVAPGDFDGFRKAARRSFSLWGGRYHPIIPVGDPEQARRLVDLYRVDCLWAASDDEAVHAFIKGNHHLPWPSYFDGLVLDTWHAGKVSAFADLLTPARLAFEETFKTNPHTDPFLLLHEWREDDPLSDVLLATFGALPSPVDAAGDYRGLLQFQLRAQTYRIDPDQPFALPDSGRISLADLNHWRLQQQYPGGAPLGRPGFYIGDGSNFDDLVAFWNLRAAGIALQFHDPLHGHRLAHATDQWLSQIPQMLDRGRTAGAAIWSRNELEPATLEGFGQDPAICLLGEKFGKDPEFSIVAVSFGNENVLAAVDNNSEPPSFSFAIPNCVVKETGSETGQQFIVAIETGSGVFANGRFALQAPFLPELNGFYGSSSGLHWNRVRAEGRAIGVIVGGATTHLTMRAVDTRQLFAAIFASVGIKAAPSSPGLVCDRLIHQMGGIDNCGVFRIRGVRDLIEKHSPDQNFTRSTAKQAILAKDTSHPLSMYQGLHIDPRPFDKSLTNDAVLEHLLRKDIFRPGLELECPSCRLHFWRPIDDVRTKVECEYCGHLFHIGPQLRDRDWAFRRSGLFGRNDSQQGAIPVVLTLQQLANVNLFGTRLLTTAMELEPDGADIPKCETDFVCLLEPGRDGRIQLAIGECKTRHKISQNDVQNLLRVARAFPEDRFAVFLVFAKLAEFTDGELELIARANDENTQRAIVLTDRELEPVVLYQRASTEFDVETFVSDFEGMAKATHQIFFEKRRRSPDGQPAPGQWLSVPTSVPAFNAS